MKLLKPKRQETVKGEYDILKSTRLIFELYGKYTQYSSGEILDHLALQVLKEDDDFVKWVSEQHTNKKFFQYQLEQELRDDQKKLFEQHDEGSDDEQNEEICK